MTVWEELQARGLIAQVTNEDVDQRNGKQRKSHILYWL